MLVSFSENNLLINELSCSIGCASIHLDLLTEFIEWSWNGFILAWAELFSCLDLMDGSLRSFYAQENLWKILRFPVRHCPLVIFWLEGRCFLLAVLACGFTLAFALSLSCCWLLDIFGSFWELLILNINTFFGTFLFIAELETNDSLNFSDILFNGHEFIHQSQLKSITLIQQLWRVAETFNDHEFLIWSLLSNLFIDQCMHKSLVVMDWRKFSFVEFISNLGGQANIFLSLRSHQSLTPLRIAFYFLFKDLIDRNVDHIEFDCKVCACSVNTQSLFMVH